MALTGTYMLLSDLVPAEWHGVWEQHICLSMLLSDLVPPNLQQGCLPREDRATSGANRTNSSRFEALRESALTRTLPLL
jgi:hypothetical protein